MVSADGLIFQKILFSTITGENFACLGICEENVFVSLAQVEGVILALGNDDK